MPKERISRNIDEGHNGILEWEQREKKKRETTKKTARISVRLMRKEERGWPSHQSTRMSKSLQKTRGS